MPDAARAGTQLLAWPLQALLLTPDDATRPPGTHSLSPVLSPPSPLSLSRGRNRRRRRPQSPWPRPLPHLPDTLPSSAATPSTSSSSHAPPDGLHRRHRRLFTAGRRGSPSPPRRPQRVPELAVKPIEIPVSCCSSSHSPFSPSHTAAASLLVPYTGRRHELCSGELRHSHGLP